MKQKIETCDYADLEENLLPQLRETIFHVTSGNGLEKILAEKKILPNINNRFNFSYPQSNNSFGIKRGYICLFDLRNIKEETLEETLLKFYFLAHHKWDINAFLILDIAALNNLIPNEVAKRETGFKEMWIPEVEVWSPTPIPLNKISNIIKVEITNRPDPTR